MKFRRHRRERPEVSVIPMIDVLTVLLVFFIVSTTFNRQSELNITLPEAKGQPAEEQQVLEVSIDAQGRYYIDRQPVPDPSITGLIRALRTRATVGRLPLVISADRQTAHRFVIRALDAAGQAGYTHIGFAAEDAPEG